MLPDRAMLEDAARQAAACAARLRLPLRARVWQGAAGELAGSGTGASMDFQDHRPYFPGDDPRHINWQAYARTGNYTMKLYREEVRPAVDLLLDVSASMFLTPDKARRTAALLHLAFECALRAGAAPAVYLLRGGAAGRTDAGAVAALRWVEDIPADADAPHAMPPVHALPLRPGGLRVLVSDLLFTGDPAPLLRALTHGRGSGIVFCPFADEEARPDWRGPCDFEEVEGGEREWLHMDGATMRRYLAAYQTHCTLWKEQAVRFRVPLARVAAAGPLDSALTAGALAAGALETC
jgi:uncharacterized protein (DUF58 family)